jgi:hypothetical protein
MYVTAGLVIRQGRKNINVTNLYQSSSKNYRYCNRGLVFFRGKSMPIKEASAHFYVGKGKTTGATT